MDRTHRLLFVADPNGGLIPGSNMEFLEMPLQKLQRKPTTKISCYDQSELERFKQPVFIGKPNGEIQIGAYAKKRAPHTNDTMSPKEDGRKRYHREEISSSSSSSSSSSKTASEVAH
jgi:hypothetical protein